MSIRTVLASYLTVWSVSFDIIKSDYFCALLHVCVCCVCVYVCYENLCTNFNFLLILFDLNLLLKYFSSTEYFTSYFFDQTRFMNDERIAVQQNV